MSNNFANEPQPRTFAPSREDVLSNLAFFFGDPATPERLRDYSEHHAMTFHFPDAVSFPRVKKQPLTVAQDLHAAFDRAVLRPEHQDPRHPQQPHPQGETPRHAPRLPTPPTTRRGSHSLRLCFAQSPQSWQTSVGLPFLQITGTVRLIFVKPPTPCRRTHTRLAHASPVLVGRSSSGMRFASTCA